MRQIARHSSVSGQHCFLEPREGETTVIVSVQISMVVVCLLRQLSECDVLVCGGSYGSPEMSNKLQFKKTPENIKPRQQHKREVEYFTVEIENQQ